MSAVDLPKLRSAISNISMTVFDSAAWPHVMEEICAAVGADGAVLLQGSDRTRDVPRTASVDEMINFYFKNDWHKTDLRALGLPLLESGQGVYTDQDCVSDEMMRRSDYYNDFVYRTGFKWFAGVGFYANQNLWVMAMQRAKKSEPFSIEEKQLLRTLCSHLTSAATLVHTFGSTLVANQLALLNDLNRAAIVIGREGIVLQINRSADALFDDMMFVRNRRLMIVDKQAEIGFRLLVEAITSTSESEVPAVKPILVRRSSKSPVLIRILPIGMAARNVFLGGRAILVFNELDTKNVITSEDISLAFGLTGAEARVASLIAGGLSLDQAAHRIGISVITARNQIKAAMTKTGTHRQAHLATLILQAMK